MRIIKKGKEETYQDLYPGQYEFKLCGGAVEPKDRIEPAKLDKSDKDAK